MARHVAQSILLAGLCAVIGLAGCTRAPTPDAADPGATSPIASPGPEAGPGADGAPAAQASMVGVASRGAAPAPDRGALFAFETPLRSRRTATGEAWAVLGSEAHAFSAAAPGGSIALPLPGGGVLPLRYARHVEHADGNWTWFGRTDDGGDAVITFGATAVFGDVLESPARRLTLSTRGGRLWLAAVDPARERDGHHAPGAQGTDALPAPTTSAMSALLGEALARRADTPVSMPTIDVLLGYTAAFATANGGPSGAETRLQHLVAVANAGYANSQLPANLRLVGTRQVAYQDANDNQVALQDLTGFTCTPSCTPRPVPASLQPLRDLRETTGADLVALVRPYRTPEQAGCGVAWLLGGDGSAFNASQAPFGYSVVSDGQDTNESDGLLYGCRVESLAHELGHNMGQAHNVEDASGTGAHPYAYGYREASTNGFYTIMAYRLAGSQQQAILHFANPQVAFNGRPTGTAQADNVRSLLQTMPIVAQFRATVVPPPPTPARSDLTVLDRVSAGSTRIAALSGAANYQSLFAWRNTALHPTGNDDAWVFRVADRDRDGSNDVYALKRVGGGGRLEVHVLDGRSGFERFQLQVVTPLAVGPTARWVFDLGDFNGDGVPDLYAIERMGGYGTTEVHVLDGASNFQAFTLHASTALHQTGTDGAWKFTLGDRNGDGVPDLYVIKRDGASGQTELHVLDGASWFSRYTLHAATALHATGSGHDWDFAVADYNGDGIRDLYVIKKQGAAGTEVHVLDGASGYTTWLTHLPTPLPGSGADQSRVFDIP